MAAPAFAAAGTLLAGSNSASASIAVPSGVAANDIILAFLTVQLGPSAPPAVTGIPSGFTEAASSPASSAVSTDLQDWHVYWKRATAADAGTYDFTMASAPQWRTGFALRYTGCVTSGNPIDAAVGAGNSATSLNFPNTSLTTLGPDRLVVWTGGAWDGFACTQPSGFTIDAQGVTNNTSAGMCITSKSQAVAGSTGTLSASFSSGTLPKSVWLGALLPATAGASTSTSDMFAMF